MEGVTSYTDYRHFRPMTVRERIRKPVLDLMAMFSGKDIEVDESKSGIVVFLAYHFLFEENHGNFRKLLDLLSRKYKFLTVTDAVNQVKEGTLTGHNICFTCDDGFRSCLSAAKILEEYDARCCFFLCPDFVGLEDSEHIRFLIRTGLVDLQLIF